MSFTIFKIQYFSHKFKNNKTGTPKGHPGFVGRSGGIPPQPQSSPCPLPGALLVSADSLKSLSPSAIAPLGHRSYRSPTALQAAASIPCTRQNENTGCPQGASGVFSRSGGIRTRGLLVPNQTRYQTALHLDKKLEPIMGLEPMTC